MGEKLIIGPIDKGLRTDRTAFVIDNDSFPKLINAYQWRGRVKRKRGTSRLTRLQRIIGTTDDMTGDFTIIIDPHPILPGISVFMVGTNVFIDWDVDASDDPITLITDSLTSTATLNRSTGELIITGGDSNPLTNVIYFPALPVMGLEDVNIPTQAYSGTIGFDTTYSYLVSNFFPYTPIDISFYKNPLVDAVNLPGYVPKNTQTPLHWNGKNYQQFWTTNYQDAFWATNGIQVPFLTSNVGMQFKSIVSVAVISGGPPATATLQITGHGLVVGDFIFVNEVVTTTGINFQTGYVITVTDANNVIVEFPFATLVGNGTSGIAQYLTNTSIDTVDSIRWYDGNVSGQGWVNFSPPLSQGLYSINDSPPAQYYLAGARMIVPFKDRLLFFGPVIQDSSNRKIYLQDTCIYSQNGTPYYMASFTGDPLNQNTIIHTVLAPTNQTSFPTAWWEDQTGFGGFEPARIDEAITTVSSNEDALIIGYNENTQQRFVYTGNDITPFQFYTINNELGSLSTFSAINLDEGVLTRGNRGFILTAQTSCRRFDLDVPDQVFQISNSNNGAERMSSQRDYINEWVYFTYPSNEFMENVFPNQTLQYNYRDDSWAVFNETYTTYGIFRPIDGFTWGNIGTKYKTWGAWNETWGSGVSTPLKPKVIAGNQQGYITMRDQGTGEQQSLYIQNIVGNLVTSPNHCLNNGDFIIIRTALGTVSTKVNDKIFQVLVQSVNTFNILSDTTVSGTYLGGGEIVRMYVPQIFSKQFPTAWGVGRKTRIGPQQYLFNKTDLGQVSLLIYLSMNQDDPGNDGPIYPDINSNNDGLIYDVVVHTCHESTNLGLTPANTNLQQYTTITEAPNSISSSNKQSQIWHRVNTSLIGDTVQFAITLSPNQMRHPNPTEIQFAEIEFHGAILDVSPSSMLS